MTDADVRSLSRKARRTRRGPRDATCEICGTGVHLRRQRDGRVICYQDLRAAAGAGPVEHDHLAGRNNLAGITVALLGNDHRTVTEIRMRLGIDEWPAAEGDSLLMLAHLLAGVATLLVLVAEWLLDHASALRDGLVQRAFPVVP